MVIEAFFEQWGAECRQQYTEICEEAGIEPIPRKYCLSCDGFHALDDAGHSTDLSLPSRISKPTQ